MIEPRARGLRAHCPPRTRVEDALEARDDARAAASHGGALATPSAAQRRHAVLRDAAGDDEAKAGEVGRHVEGEPVHRDPARDAHANRADLRGRAAPVGLPRVAWPRAGLAASTHTPTSFGSPSMKLASTPWLPSERDHDAREVANVAAHVAAVGLQVEDGVRHELPGTVVGDVPSPPRLVDVDAESAETLRASASTFSSSAARPSVTTGSCSSRSSVSPIPPRSARPSRRSCSACASA